MKRIGRTVLLIDDNAGVRKGLRTLFESSGFLCIESENGAEAVERVKREKPDLIVLDFSMPVMNGLEAAPLLKEMLPETPIIMFTMFASEAFTKLATAAGATAVFSKDQAGSQLLPEARALMKASGE